MDVKLLFRSLEESNADFMEEYSEDIALGDIDDPKNMVVDTINEGTWDAITKNYFDCSIFYHPMITFNHDM
ncbi:hypothetical protein QEN19_000913 [Hanseniaspora menglaensis]